MMASVEINTTDQALAACGVTAQTLTVAHKDSLDRNGYVVLPPDPAYWRSRGTDLAEMRAVLDELSQTESWRGGSEGKEDRVRPDKPLDPGSNRLGNLVEKHRAFRACFTHPAVLAAARYVIGRDMKCSGVDMREPRKGSGEQHMHIDWLPRQNDADPYDNVFCGIFLDDMTAANGAIRVVPGTHRKLDWPNEHIDVFSRQADEIRVEGPAGLMLVVNANTWHGGALNVNGARRRTIYVDYRARHIAQLLNQKRYLSAATIADLTPEERYLLAVRDSDPLDEGASLGPGDAYRARYGASYGRKDEAQVSKAG